MFSSWYTELLRLTAADLNTMALIEKPNTCQWPCGCWGATVADDIDFSFWDIISKNKM